MPILKKIIAFFRYKKPIVKNNTFLIWEPCSINHAEVVPGFAKYLIDLGYHVSILMEPQRYKEGLFSRFEDKNISYNQLSRRKIKKYFKKDSLENVKGVLVTTVGKLYDGKNLTQAYNFFNKKVNKNKLFFVEHEIDTYIDNNDNPSQELITLRDMDYKDAKTISINPHYFGKTLSNPKNHFTNFITIGALSDKRKSTKLLIDAVANLTEKGIKNFKITVIGKGDIKDLPKQLQPYFNIKGRLNFDKMYDEIEQSDFILSAYEDTPAHRQYITSKTSGTFQLVYGFLKPIIIRESFANINGFNTSNAILYTEDKNYCDALEKAINQNSLEYIQMQNNLKKLAQEIYNNSKENFYKLIKVRKNTN